MSRSAMDIDFGDLDRPSKPPASKAPKFAPKNSKFKPVAKPKREPESPSLTSESNPIIVPKVELDDSKPPPPVVATVNSKPETEQSPHNVPLNGNVKLENDVTEMEVGNGQQEDEGDQVVREIDVFFHSSADPDSKLYVLQYPLRQRWRPYELEDRCEKVRLKPETAEVEVEMSVQVGSENYDPDVDDGKAMSKQVLSPSWKPPSTSGDAVGILKGNELHLHAVHAVVQLRPSMQHIKPSKKRNTTSADVDIDSTDIKNEKAIKQPKKQSKLPGVVNEQNEDTKEEEWISLKYHGESSQLSRKCMQNMVTPRDTSPIQFSMTPSDYINSLCHATSVGPKRLPVSELLKLPLEERYKRKLCEGSPVRYSALKHIAPDSSEEDIFRVLKCHSQLVQGLWVAKSRLEDGGKKVLLRDYVMLQFSKSRVLPMAKLPKANSIEDFKFIEAILKQFAERREDSRDWKFKEATDNAFIKEFPDIVEEQKRNWERVEPSIVKCLSKTK